MTARTRWLLGAAAIACAAAGPATTTSPLDGLINRLASPPAATTRATASVDADAGPLLARLDTAYAAGPLQVEGDLVGTFDVAGRSRIYTLHVTGRTDGAGRFVHDAASAGRIVAGEKRGVLFDRRRNAFATFDAPGARVPADDLEPALIDVLLDENPALLLSLVDDPAAVLRLAARRISVAAESPTTQPAKRPAGPGLTLDCGDKRITLRLDSESGAIRSTDIDFTPLMTTRRAAAVKAARATLTYTTAARTVPPDDAFAWDPPATATEFNLHEELVRPARPATRPRRR